MASTPDVPPEPTAGRHPAGVPRVLAIATAAALVGLLAWVVPGAERFRMWEPGEPLPFSGLLTQGPGGGGFAAAFQRPDPSLTAQSDEELLEAAPLPEAVALPEPEVEAIPEPAEASTLARIDPEAYRGLTRALEDEGGAMRAFYRSLARVHGEEEGALSRISVYGTSTNGADRMTSQLRRLLQAQLGDGGKGWVPVAAGWRYQRHQDVGWDYGTRWRTYVVNRGNGPLDRYGMGGVVATNRNRAAAATFETTNEAPGDRVDVFRLFYQAWPDGGVLRTQLDDGEPRRIETAAEAPEDRVVELRPPAGGAHRLTLRPEPASDDDPAAETLRLYGVAMETDGPGVVVDGMALVGAFTRVLLNWDENHLRRQLELREPDLLVFWMGANDAVSQTVPFIRREFVADYREVLRRFRAGRPEASCLVMSILDKGERVDGRIRTRRRVQRVVTAQREVAEAEGCAFFDTFEALGGDGTMRRWYRARPRLVTDDLGHLTEPGSRVLGTLLSRALLKGYDDWLAAGQPE